MFECRSSSGRFSDQLYAVEVTIMNPAEFPYPISKHTIFNVSIKCKDREQTYEVSDFCFYLICGITIYNSIDVAADSELLKYVEGSGTGSMFSGIPRVGWCGSQSLTVLFPRVDEVHYKPSALIFCYKPDMKFIPIRLID